MRILQDTDKTCRYHCQNSGKVILFRTPIRRADITAKILGTLPSTKSPILCHRRNTTDTTIDAPAQYRQTIRPPDSKTPSSSPVNSTEPWVERAEEATRLHVLRLRPDSGMPPTMPTKPPPPPPLNMEGIKKVLAQRYVPTSLCSSTMLINLLNQTLIVVPYILLLGNAADDACKASTSPAAQHGGDQEGLAPGPRDSPYLPPFSPI
ncbi:hypothetical protein D6D22_10823 [Aureobasidium pullulans]|uniref:Uncharacterized protein n=1 Tax=Aureobasidium pullulans TaxID=5580 RepID=A0A4S8WK39_AURPU|nr:hypothetical protein D6D22_10823 [Aureobasidium pullulans]